MESVWFGLDGGWMSYYKTIQRFNYVIYFISADGKIRLLAEGTNGPSFVVKESGIGPTTNMKTFVQLINALMSIQQSFTQDLATNWPIMVSLQILLN
jgi:hypothetical protein